MAASLTHLAESIFVAMVNASREKFVKRAGLDMISTPVSTGAGGVAFREVGLEPYAGRAFDGAAKIDAVVTLSDKLAVPFELKLGTTRLTKSRIDTEWLVACEPSSHGDCRWSGNMMAILERNFRGVESRHDLIGRVRNNDVSSDGDTFVLTREWFVVARRSVVSRWKNSPPAFSSNVRLLVFEDVVDDFGGKLGFQ